MSAAEKNFKTVQSSLMSLGFKKYIILNENKDFYLFTSSDSNQQMPAVSEAYF